jgi:Protein of unknown function (DUF2671)
MTLNNRKNEFIWMNTKEVTMTYNNNLINKLSMSSKQIKASSLASESTMAETMSDARYLRQSSSLINDALQKGFDVLQLADGDIVMTGVKTVSYQYSWDAEKGKLLRTKATSSKDVVTPAKTTIDLDELEREEEFQM